MDKGSQKDLKSFKKLHIAYAVAFVLLAVSFVSLYLLYSRATQSLVHEESLSTPISEVREQAVILPISLSIPRISLNATFEEPLGLNEDHTIEVPKSFETVGWYKYSPTPGEIGPAVVLGHIDSKEGPAVFYSLGQLTTGDEIEIKRNDGAIVRFTVIKLERYEQAGFPAELVYGDIDHAGLRLITCSGTYDRGKQRYSHNLVVYAALTEDQTD